MDSDRLLRVGTVAAVLVVAAIAAVVSYSHLYHLAYTHGEPRLDSALIPVATDGTVVASSLLMLRAARKGLPTPWLARGMLVLSVSVTLAANMAFGWPYAIWGIVLAGAPVIWFIGNAESVIAFGRKSATLPESDKSANTIPSGHLEAAETWFRATVKVGNPATLNTLQDRFSLTRAQATKVRTGVLAESNGHAPLAAE